MTKTEFVDKFMLKFQVPRQTAEKIIAAFLDSLEDGLCKDDKVILRGFGTFEKVDRNARTCRNPRTGETINVEKSKSVVFRPAKQLKEQISGDFCKV